MSHSEDILKGDTQQGGDSGVDGRGGAARRASIRLLTQETASARSDSRLTFPPGNDTVEGLLCDAAALPHHAFFLIRRPEKDANCRLREGDVAGSAGGPGAPPGRRQGCRQGTAASSKGSQDF